MSLEAILAAIEAQESRQIEAERQTAAAKAAALLEQAEREAVAAEQAAYEAAISDLPLEQGRRLQQARLAAGQLLSQARAAVVGEIIEACRLVLTGARQQPEYATLLPSLLAEAVTALGPERGSGPLILLADPRDQPLLAQEQTRFDCRFTLDCWGGVVVMSADEKVIADNRLESRFERAQPLIRRTAAALRDDGARAADE